jgi:predicted ATP-dependent protease
LTDLPGSVTDAIHILPVKTIDEVIHLALVGGNIGIYSGHPLANLGRTERSLVNDELWEEEGLYIANY